MKLSPKRFFYVMTGWVALLLVISIAAVVVGNNMLAAKNDKLAELKLENSVLDEQRIALAQAKRDIQQYAELEGIAKQIVPQEKDQARTVRELINFGKATGVNIISVGFSTSTLGDKANAPSAITQLEPVEGLSGVYQMEINLGTGNTIDFPTLIAFMDRLESNRRTAQVSEITITPSAEDRNLLDFSLALNVYIKPD